MATVKEKIISGLEGIQDEDFLNSVLALISDKQAEDSVIQVSKNQEEAFSRARKDYDEGRYYTTEELFAELEND